jgi:hypothetical protein
VAKIKKETQNSDLQMLNTDIARFEPSFDPDDVDYARELKEKRKKAQRGLLDGTGS